MPMREISSRAKTGAHMLNVWDWLYSSSLFPVYNAKVRTVLQNKAKPLQTDLELHVKHLGRYLLFLYYQACYNLNRFSVQIK